MHRAELAECVVIAHFEPGGLSLVFEILRLLANGSIGEELVVLPDLGRPHDRHVMLEPAAIADLDIRSDDAVGADVNVRANFRRRVDDGGRVNRGRHA